MAKHICKSGLTGWKMKLRRNWETYSFFESCCNNYGIHTRLGFKTPHEAWAANPTVCGSVLPEDLGVVK